MSDIDDHLPRAGARSSSSSSGTASRSRSWRSASSLSLWATGVLDLNQSLAGFGDPAVIFIASLFVVSESLDATGVTVVGRAGADQPARREPYAADRPDDAARRGADGADQRQRRGRRAAAGGRRDGGAARPLAVAAAAAARLRRARRLAARADGHAGERDRLGGRATRPASGSFGYFEFALVGVPLVVGTIAIVVLFGERLLPHRSAARRSRPTSATTRARSSSSTSSTHDAGRAPHAQARRRRGRHPAALELRSARRSSRAWSPTAATSSSSPCSETARTSARTRRVLAVGDTLLLRGTWDALEENLDDPAVLVVDAARARPAAGGAARARARSARSSCSPAMVVLLATGAVPPVVAGLLAAGAIVVLGVLDVEQCYRAISWTTVILVAGMIPLSTAMTRDRRRGEARRRARATSSATPDRYALLARPLRAHRRARPADQQHGDGADRDPGRRLGRGRHGRLGEAGADVASPSPRPRRS